LGGLTFYFDRCFGKRFPEALKRANPPFNVEFQNNSKFKQDMDDDEWLSIVGERGWIVFSHDQKFHSLTVEAAAVRQFGIGCFYLYGANSPIWDKLQYFVRAYPKIDKIIRTETKPYIYDIGSNGRIRQIGVPK